MPAGATSIVFACPLAPLLKLLKAPGFSTQDTNPPKVGMLDILGLGMRKTIASVTISDLPRVIAALQKWGAYIRPPDHLNLSQIVKKMAPFSSTPSCQSPIGEEGSSQWCGCGFSSSSYTVHAVLRLSTPSTAIPLNYKSGMEKGQRST